MDNFPANGSTSRINEQLVSVIIDLASAPPELAFEDEEDSFAVIV
jgi:hypothetical protein